MPTQEIYSGREFDVRGWVEGGSCLVLDFLEELTSNGDKDAERLVNLISRIADNGMTHNKRHVRSLGDGIFEFKSFNTARILFFYDSGARSLIICTHGFTGKKGAGGKNIKKEISRAERIKDEYLNEKD